MELFYVYRNIIKAELTTFDIVTTVLFCIGYLILMSEHEELDENNNTNL